MKIGIMGLGFVGNATKEVFEKVHQLYCYDPLKEGYQDKKVLKNAEIIFICVNTPMKQNGEEDLSQVESACKIINDLGINPIVCIRSTVSPGTSKKFGLRFGLRIGHNPEFMRAKYATQDLLNSNRIIIGGTEEVRKKIKEVYLPLFPNVIYKELSSDESEMVKHITNAFLSMRIGFVNEIYNICKILNINYDKIKEIVHLDKRLGSYIDVPGPDGKFGFGGYCLPKDLNSFITCVEREGYIPILLKELLDFNKKQRKEKIVSRIKIPKRSS